MSPDRFSLEYSNSVSRRRYLVNANTLRPAWKVTSWRYKPHWHQSNPSRHHRPYPTFHHKIPRHDPDWDSLHQLFGPRALQALEGSVRKRNEELRNYQRKKRNLKNKTGRSRFIWRYVHFEWHYLIKKAWLWNKEHTEWSLRTVSSNYKRRVPGATLSFIIFRCVRQRKMT